MNMPAPEVLFGALLLGVGLGAVYTVLEAVRILLSLKKAVTFLLDVFFCLAAAAASFLFALADTGGVLRFYHVLLAAVGFAAVNLTVTYFLCGVLRRLTGKCGQKGWGKRCAKAKKRRFFAIDSKNAKKRLEHRVHRII